MAVKVEGVTLTFQPERRGAEPVQALSDVSLQAQQGQLVAVVGPSGCGKSTLLELICGLLTPERGTVTASPAALMPQRDMLLPWASAIDNAALALRVGPDPVPQDQARERTRVWFQRLGLSGFEHARPHELSGGMRQRVAFLRTLLSGKRVLCLDEPFGALDAITRQEMQRWLSGVLSDEAAAGDARTVVLVTHDVEEAVLLADRVLILSPRPGRVAGVVQVDLEKPRTASDPRVVALRAHATELLTAACAPVRDS